MVEEHQIAGLSHAEALDLFTAVDLLRCVARQADAKQAHHRLRHTRAVHTQCVLAAPQVRRVEHKPQNLHQLVLIERHRLLGYGSTVDTERYA